METAGTESRCAGVYEQYKMLRQDMIAYQTAKQNVDRILGTELPEPEQTQKHCSPMVFRIRDTQHPPGKVHPSGLAYVI